MTATIRRASEPPTPQPSSADRPPGRVPAQLVRFAAVGVVSTIAHLGLYALLRGVLGTLPANLVSLLITAIANTAANRRLTFGVTGRRDRGRHHVQGLVIFGLGLAVTSGALALLTAIDPSPARIAELAVLASANLSATVLRFVLFRLWVFRPRRTRTP